MLTQTLVECRHWYNVDTGTGGMLTFQVGISRCLYLTPGNYISAECIVTFPNIKFLSVGGYNSRN